MSELASGVSSVSLGRDWVRCRNHGLFASEHDLLRNLVLRLFSLPEIISIQLDPSGGSITIRYQTEPSSRKVFLASCCDAIEGRIQPLDTGMLPRWQRERPVTWYRHGQMISSWRPGKSRPGRLEIHYPGLDAVADRAARVAKGLRQLQGVASVSLSASSGKVLIAHDPERISVHALLRAADDLVWNTDRLALPAVKAEPVRFATVNTSLGLAAAGELVLPLATPLSAGIMLVTNVGTMRDALRDIGRGKLTTPTWMMALLACSIVSGQVLAFALTDWSWRYWERRTRKELEKQQQRVMQETVSLPAVVDYVSAEGVEMTTPVAAIKVDERLTLHAGQHVPVDAQIISGSVLVDEQAMTGEIHPVRKVQGDALYASSRIIFGQALVSVTASGLSSRALSMVEDFNRSAVRTVATPEVHAAGQRLSDRAVPPTLAAAAVGLAMGNLFVVGAILHQDWFSAAHLAAPMATLQESSVLMRQGLLLRDPGALYRLRQSRFLVIKDHPGLEQPSWLIDKVDHGVMDHDAFLRMVAGAGLYLGDARTDALLAACSSQQLAVRQPLMKVLEENTLSVEVDRQILTLTSLPAQEGMLPSIKVSLDGVDAGSVSFAPDARPRAAEAIQRIRDLGVQVFLVSDRSEQEASVLSASLGADLYSGDMDDIQVTRFLEGLAKRGLYPAFASADVLDAATQQAAHVSMALGYDNDRSGECRADIVAMGERLDALVTLFTLAYTQDAKLRQTLRSGLIPNLLCVVGGFAGVLNGITSGILGNIGVLNVQRRVSRNMDASLSGHHRRLLR